MKKKLVLLLVVFSLLSISVFGIVNFTTASTQPESTYDVDAIFDTKLGDDLSLEGVEFTVPHSPWYYPTINDVYGVEWRYFDNIFNGTYGNIWVSLDPDLDEYIDLGPAGYSPEDIFAFGYPWTPTGIDGYLPAGYRDAITGADLLEVLSEFDNNIHDTDIDHFGPYDYRAGPYGDGKVQIMVFNIREDFYYDPPSASSFIEGYFWGSIANWGVNAFHMDTFQWWRRQGGSPPMIDILTGDDYNGVLSVKPWEYEGTFAHEFQHLIHFDRDEDELSWVDEGCATLAEWLCGYGFSPGHISEYLFWFWDTPLTIWEGYLSDYGASFLFTFYMYEHYGGADLIKDLVYEQANGIEGWNNVLAARGIWRRFDQIFQDWCIANYLDDTSIYWGLYGYYDLDIPSENSEFESIQSSMEFWNGAYGSDYFDWYINEYPHGGYEGAYIGAGRGLAYTANYIEFTDTPFNFEVKFDGDDFCGAPPTSGTYNWYSGVGGDRWYTVSRTFDIPTTGATLTFQNAFSIEAFYDYAYVEISIDGSDDWYTLEGLGTTSDYQNPYVHDACPDNREPYTYNELGRWNAFTGDSGGIYEEMMVIPDMFNGQTVEIVFTYWTDPYTNGAGWYIDDIALDGFTDDCEDFDGWTVINLPEGSNGWQLNDVIIYNDFRVTFLQSTTLYKRDGTEWRTCYYTYRMGIWDDTEEGRLYLYMPNSCWISSKVVMVVANQPGYEHTFGTSYTYNAHKWVRPHHHCWWW